MKENCLCNIVLAVIAMKERWNIKKIKQRWRERERERALKDILAVAAVSFKCQLIILTFFFCNLISGLSEKKM